MSSMTTTLRLHAARPASPARRALLALAVTLARVAMHRPDHRAAATRRAAEEQRDRAALRLLALTPPLR